MREEIKRWWKEMNIPSTYCSMKPMRPNVLTAFRRVNVWWNVREFHICFEKCLEGAQTHGTLWGDDSVYYLLSFTPVCFCYSPYCFPVKLLDPRHQPLSCPTPLQDSFVEMLTIISHLPALLWCWQRASLSFALGNYFLLQQNYSVTCFSCCLLL